MSAPHTLSQQNWFTHPATQQLIHAFDKAGEELRFVGGAVRDGLLGRIVTDVDACTPALPQRVTALLKEAQIKTIPTGIDHGTVTAIIEGFAYEITTLREDTSCDGRHAEVAFTTDWRIDASRRDLTMNALYCDTQGKCYDYYHGIEDAQTGRIRFIGAASDRIQEDALRILRAFRFLATHGHEALDEDTLHACSQHASMIHALSGERIQHEMKKLLSAPEPFFSLNSMPDAVREQLLLSGCQLETLEHVIDAEQNLQQTPNPWVRLAALLRSHDEPAQQLQAIQTRWKLSNKDSVFLNAIIAEELIADDALESNMKTRLRHLGATHFQAMILLSWKTDYFQVLDVAQRLVQTWQPPVFPLSGADLMAIGYASNAQLGESLRKLEAFWESMEYAPDKAQLIAMASQWLDDANSNT